MSKNSLLEKEICREEKGRIVEASSVVGILKSSGRSIRKTTKGFLGRILEFIGKLILGWAILNLPKIIKSLKM